MSVFSQFFPKGVHLYEGRFLDLPHTLVRSFNLDSMLSLLPAISFQPLLLAMLLLLASRCVVGLVALLAGPFCAFLASRFFSHLLANHRCSKHSNCSVVMTQEPAGVSRISCESLARLASSSLSKMLGRRTPSMYFFCEFVGRLTSLRFFPFPRIRVQMYGVWCETGQCYY